MAVDRTDLLTVDQLVVDSLESSALLDGLSTDDRTAIERVIGSVSRAIEQHLDRNLIVRQYSSFRPKWRLFTERDSDNSDNEYYAWTDEWPVVEVETTDTTIRIHEDEDRILADSKPDTVDLFAGYEREDQDATGDLSDLDTSPDTLPNDIRDAAVRLCLHRLRLGEEQLWGIDERQVNVRGEAITTRSADPGFRSRVLSQIDPGHRRIPA